MIKSNKPMDAGNHVIIINGENRTYQVESIRLDGQKYAIKFQNSPKIYSYNQNKVVWLTHPVKLDIVNSRIFINNRRVYKIKEVRLFAGRGLKFNAVVYENGYVKQYSGEEVDIRTSCLTGKSADIFEYIRQCAGISTLGQIDDDGDCDDTFSEGILSAIYSKIDFVDEKTAASVYLNHGKGCGKHKINSPIFPFGCNASQLAAVKAALSNQISVIQGPPGTGKTQTILNIIANLLIAGKSILVVSNNNSATDNVLEKLDKNGLAFIAARLGKKENREAFIANQPKLNPDIKFWSLSSQELNTIKEETFNSLNKVETFFGLSEKLAMLQQELADVEVEKRHFEKENAVVHDSGDITMRSRKVLKILDKLKALTACFGEDKSGLIARIKIALKKLGLEARLRFMLGIKSELTADSIPGIITLLEHIFYVRKISELGREIASIENQLAHQHSGLLMNALTDASMKILKAHLSQRYRTERHVLTSVAEIKNDGERFLNDYPVVLSTAFSSKSCISSDKLFDYVIMDEASQVGIDTGLLAMTCAENAVIVGDTMQLPNVVKDEDAVKLDEIKKSFKIPDEYDVAKNSFLSSVLTAVSGVSETLLREHYRCHPDIINFCNQKFYGGNLLIMTNRGEDDKPLIALKTSGGTHCRGRYNQREIDAVKLELLPKLGDKSEIGIIAPYNRQVDQFVAQIPDVEVATVHKYQGREKNTIVMSVTDDIISEFSDNANLLNVAVSRARDRFCLVVSGNQQPLKGNIHDLIGYINYQKGIVVNSKLHSVYDYLFSAVAVARRNAVSEFESENLTFDLIEQIRKTYPALSHIKALCHYPLRSLIRDTTGLTERERKYAMNPLTHIDFLIINRVSKEPLLAIETDGYSYHNEKTEQYKRDRLKDNILSVYGLPLLRLSTVGHSEESRIVEALLRGQK